MPHEPAGHNKWLAEATADWAVWNYYKKPLSGYGISRFTLNPHMAIFEQFDEGKIRFVRYYHASILLAYISSFVLDESFVGDIYNHPVFGKDILGTIKSLVEEGGHDFDEVFTDFAARTAAWDYPDPTISDDFERNERGGINAGEPDYRFVDVLTKVGTYGIYQSPPDEFEPGPYGWNAYRIDTTTASTYTIKFKGNSANPDGSGFTGKIIKGVKGSYEYIDFPISDAVATGNGETQIEVEAKHGEQLFLVVVATSWERKGKTLDQKYEYAIESSEHILPDDHIRKFVLEEQTKPADIDHENYIVNIEVVRGTDASALSPVITLSEGATCEPASGVAIDFTNPVTYTVTGPGSTTPKEWTVNVSVVPDRTDTDFLTFELKELQFATINTKDHIVTVNLISELDLTSVVPVFTLSPGATCYPDSGKAVNLTNPVTYIITAEDGVTTQNWIVKAENFRPFITIWETEAANEEISIPFSNNKSYDFQYVWKDANGDEVASNSISAPEGGQLNVTLPEAGIYTLEIIGDFPHLVNYPKQKLKDISQWGDIPWGGMELSFAGWPGDSFSATDLPYLNDVSSLYCTFRSASSFNGDLSQWDVSNVKSMISTFDGAKSFNSDISQWDVSNVSNMNQMFAGAHSFNADISSWDVSSLRNMNRMFFSTPAFNRNIGNWNIGSVTTMWEVLRSSGLSTLNYDRVLIGWSAQDVYEDIDFGANGLKYCAGEEARSYLINEKNWIITDGGLNCPESGGTDILIFELDEQTSPALYDDENHTITIEVAAGTDVTSLTPTLILSKDATSTPASGELVDFTDSVVYTVTALDNTTQQNWLVKVTEEEIENP
ncbi:MAG: BspA family leucine-rich repeat surface protein, partial [Bacteroidales bacterium]|nr:BspA family leucine-rich repeat surface protein [Bacteroidales bacterium]